MPPVSKNTKIALICIWVAAGMVGLSYAAVPLYRMFCQVTGFDGTTKVAMAAPGRILDRKMTIRFDANTERGLPWNFKPEQISQEIRVGEVSLAHYRVRNNGSRPLTATATFNVTPLAAGQYFNKLACFCFELQTLAPGEERDMPVSYFIDPEIVNERGLDSLKTITLSYTFFRRDDVAVDKTNTAGRASNAIN
jgi:cytochrome c oxidase assembly protein subunit 11